MMRLSSRCTALADWLGGWVADVDLSTLMPRGSGENANFSEPFVLPR